MPTAASPISTSFPTKRLALWRGNPQLPPPSRLPPPGRPNKRAQPYSLWWYLMLLVLGAALAESLLASRYLATQREEP